MSDRHKLNSLKTKILNKLFFSLKFSCQGFTLTELLLAAFISVFVIGAAGFGLIQIMEVNNKSEELNSRKLNLSRAINFIALEAQMAEKIVNPSTLSNFTAASGSSNVEQVIALEIPHPDNPESEPPYEVVYYIAQPPNSSPWSGQRVIYRWGPTLELDGDYTPSTGYNSSNSNHNKNYVLTDFISDQVPSQNPSCPSGWAAYPDQNDREGFYACVRDEAIASIYLEGEKDQADDVVVVESKIFARLALP